MNGGDPVSEEIRSVRERIARHGEYVNSEFRTKYVVIDPILRSLGWNTADPGQVRMEHRGDLRTKVQDYILLDRDRRTPALVLEAKQLPESAVTLARYAEKEESKGKLSLWESEILNELTVPQRNQLEEYVQDLDMRVGYAVLTNGADWWIYNLELYDVGNGTKFEDTVSARTNITLDSPSRASAILRVMSRPD